VAFDAQSAWVELGAFIASKPNHGRHDLLSEAARIAERNTAPEEEFQRALRLTLPAFAELLFDRTARTRALEDPEADVPGASRTVCFIP
jgi:hypothetical protein